MIVKLIFHLSGEDCVKEFWLQVGAIVESRLPMPPMDDAEIDHLGADSMEVRSCTDHREGNPWQILDLLLLETD